MQYRDYFCNLPYMEALNVQHGSTYIIEISGLVQGVGFRPFIYKLAHRHHVDGWVENRNDGVVILINGTNGEVELFKKEILDKAPPASDIESVTITPVPFQDLRGFMIRQSEDLSERVTEISPDIAVCPDCLSDMKSQPHRINYPFINCTHCGPRFSIIRELPYDRPYTTMDLFNMCPVCRAEYENVEDRRFHAQPVACSRCGPAYSLDENGFITESLDELLLKVSRGISRGSLYALKGVGGFHLMCDAFNVTAVSHLRSVKERDGKPFALMFRSLSAAKAYAEINDEEERLLLSWQRPIVLLKRKTPITPGISDGLSTLGIMLPFMPFHYLLFDLLDTAGIILTSGNFSDEPILISNKEASKQFRNKVDGIIYYNREIFNRSDDSVTMVVDKMPQILRRSRGYAPAPIRTHKRTEGIFAAGAELVSSFAMGKGNHVFMSQYIGDLKNFETYQFYGETYSRFKRMFRFSPKLLVHDLHPEYLSTKFARDLSLEFGGLPLLPVQHHHAHIASVMLNHGLDGEVIGFGFDGLGLGADGNLWGAEAMIAGYSDYQRMYHFEYMPLPGGDKANKESWRMALSYLYKCFGSGFQELPLPIFEEVGEREVENIRNLIDKSLNTPMISSSGRLFDAVSAILGINYRATYQAEAPMKLESMADRSEKGVYPFEIREGQVCFQPLIRNIVEDLSAGISRERISGKFHNTLATLVLDLAMRMREESDLNRVVLSGGSFQNRILTGKSYELLSAEDFEIFLPDRVPLNDQGIALGQIAVGAASKQFL
ncbi:MAG: carbamoyltransferase HypF [Bacteroidota bacterium]